MNPADFRDQMHLATGTLDTSGFGEGDLRDVALVYRTDTPHPFVEVIKTTPSQPHTATTADPLTQEPLFTENGEPTSQALPTSGAPVLVPDGALQVGDKYINATTMTVFEWDGTDWCELPQAADDPSPQADTTPTSAEEPATATDSDPADTTPVEEPARASKESKPPAGARARRGKAAG